MSDAGTTATTLSDGAENVTHATAEIVEVGGDLWASVPPGTDPMPSGHALELLAGIADALDGAGVLDMAEGNTFPVALDGGGNLHAVGTQEGEYDITAHPDLREQDHGSDLEIGVYHDHSEVEVAPAGTN